MNFSSKHEWTFDNLKKLIQTKKVIVLLEKKAFKIDNTILYRPPFNNKEASNIGFVLSENPFLPYLSLNDNLFIGSSMKKNEKKQFIQQYFTYLGIELSILLKSSEQLTAYEQVKLQLFRVLLLDKETILIDDVFQKLSIFQRQELLPLLQKIAKNKGKSILILTKDAQIAESPYMDQIINIA